MGNQSVKSKDSSNAVLEETPKPKVTYTEEELRQRLTEEEFNITQNKGTEKAWTGKYVNVTEDGAFLCVVCGVELFRTEKKFESGSGWPSFSDVANKGNVNRIKDTGLGMVRTEVACGNCNAHLGHVFEDGPKEDTGLRYCINSASLKFDTSKKTDGEDTPAASEPQQEEPVKEKQEEATGEPDKSAEQEEPTAEQDKPTEQDKPAEQDEPTPEEEKPAEQDEPTPEEDKPAEQDEPTPEEDKPAEQDEPAPEQDKPAEQDEPTPEQDKPTEQDEPAPEQDKPAEQDVPAPEVAGEQDDL